MPHGWGERRTQVERWVEIREPVSAGLSAAARRVDYQRRDEAYALLAGLEKNVVFLVFWGFLCFFFGFFVFIVFCFFWFSLVFLFICPEERVFRVFQFQEYF
jgi:hypothetical protein